MSGAGARIAKAIAAAGICSRRDAEKLVAAGRVKVNGAVIDSPALNVSEADSVEVDGRKIDLAPQRVRLFIYHKPRGLVVSHRDDRGRESVFDKLPEKYGRLVSVGRLDMASEGLLLLTNDGGFQRFMEKSDYEREYLVDITGRAEAADFEPARRGLTIDGVRYKPMRIAAEGKAWRAVITEGKNREIRRAFEYLGYPVRRLARVKYAGIELGDLAPGEVREIEVPKNILKAFEGRRPAH